MIPCGRGSRVPLRKNRKSGSKMESLILFTTIPMG